MNEHLQRAFIEVCYAIAEFNQGYAPRRSPNGLTPARGWL
jgi:hypothetical protein